MDRRRGLPLAAKLLLGGSIVVLAGFMLMVGLGAIGPVLSSAVKGVGGFMGSVTHFVSSPTATPKGAVSDAPTIEAPDQAYTNSSAVDVTVHVPAAIAGLQGYTCRLYVTLPNAQPTIVTEVPVGGTSVLVLPKVGLAKGSNAFQATVVGPGGESAKSAAVTWNLDVSKPKVTIVSPADGSSVTSPTITVKGKTQASSSVRISNDGTGATTTVSADGTGLFSTKIAIAVGPNTITVTATDPAGNNNTATVSVSRGSGSLRVTLTGSAYTFVATRLPRTVTFTAVVIGADGKRVAGASALFTVSVPGLQAIVSSPVNTNASGTATFSTSIPKGAMRGTGLATVLATMPTGTQSATDRAVLTVK